MLAVQHGDFATLKCRSGSVTKDLMVAAETPQHEIAQTLCQLFGLAPSHASKLRVSVNGTPVALSSYIPSGTVIDVSSAGAP
jgi:hypothetical protein